MDLSNEVVVDVPLADVWTAVNDLERIAPCMPGAQLTGVEGGEFRGLVKVKVGPITVQYQGVATIIDSSELDRTVKIKADGRDTRGAGNANAVIQAALFEVSPDSTRVVVDTDLTITGKVAQFGRGAIADVSGKLMDIFAQNLEEMLSADTSDTRADSAPPELRTGPRTIDSAEPEAIDVLSVAGGTIAKILVPVALVLGLVVLLIVFL